MLVQNDFLLSFWNRDYTAAEKYSHLAARIPTSQMPQVLLIYHLFFGGLVAFHLYRTQGGEERLNDGVKALDRVAQWSEISPSVFESKCLLLKAEHSASSSQHSDAEKLYLKSIEVAFDQDCVHEVALAYECMANFYSSVDRQDDCICSAKKAYIYYMQWGATAVAEVIAEAHNLDTSKVTEEM